MRLPVQQPKQAAAIPNSWPAPRDGWIANHNLAQPGMKKADGTELAGAKILDNFFPTATGIRLVRGSQVYATLGAGDDPVRSLFSYVSGGAQRMFGAIDSAIYDITTVLNPKNTLIGTENDDIIGTENDDMIGVLSTDGLDVYTGTTSGNWNTTQFATIGNTFVVGVNGADTGFVYDGFSFLPIVDGGLWTVSFTAETTPFQVGETVTGGTSGATGKVIEVITSAPGEGALIVSVTGEDSFVNGETLTGDQGGDATASSDATFLAAGVTFPAGFETMTTADFSYVFVYKQRLFFLQKESLDAWYLPVDQVGGELTRLPLGGVFDKGGSLVFGATWSNDSGNAGGLSEQCIFVTTQGEVAVYQGLSPDQANTWSKVGVYQIGIPLGPKAWIRDGGDLIIATSIGYIRMTEAIRREAAALGPYAVSYPIETAWNDAVSLRSEPWHCAIWAAKQMAVVALPTQNNEAPEMFLANVRTGAWCRRTGWDGTCVLVFQERLFFGNEDGEVMEANITGSDDGAAYTGSCVPLFSHLDAPASLKITEMIMPMGMSPVNLRVQATMLSDFRETLPVQPIASVVRGGAEWGNANWGEFTWGDSRALLPRRQWDAAHAHGYYLAPCIQVTSGSVVPLDYELVSIETTHRTAKAIS